MIMMVVMTTIIMKTMIMSIAPKIFQKSCGPQFPSSMDMYQLQTTLHVISSMSVDNNEAIL